MQANVRGNHVEQALRILKKKMQREGIFRQIKLISTYEKPTKKRLRKKSEAIRRIRKLERRRLEQEGF